MKNKKQSGITLVALVVTIVVLLILAGVSINLVLGENGLITQAKEAKEKSASGMNEENYLINSAIPDYIDAQINGNAKTITAEDYGKVVTNYQDGHTWEIFYADNKNVYLITRDNVENQTLNDKIEGYNGTSDFDGSDSFKTKYPAVQAGWLNKTYDPSAIEKIKYQSSYDNMKCTEYLLDSTIWNKKYKTDKAEWAIGGPTLELLAASYGKYTGTEITVNEPNACGYVSAIGSGLSPSKANGLYNHRYNYWLAGPNNNGNYDVCLIFNDYEDIGYNNFVIANAVRPVVCLKSDVILTKSADGSTFTIN